MKDNKSDWNNDNFVIIQKAIQESEAEWSQNQKLVDLSQKDIRKAVSK